MFGEVKLPFGKAEKKSGPVYALIKDGRVVNTIIAEKEFIEKIKHEWDHCIDITNMNVGNGFIYVSETKEFKRDSSAT